MIINYTIIILCYCTGFYFISFFTVLWTVQYIKTLAVGAHIHCLSLSQAHTCIVWGDISNCEIFINKVTEQL